MKRDQQCRASLYPTVFLLLLLSPVGQSSAQEKQERNDDEARNQFIELATQLDREFAASTAKMVLLEKTLPSQQLAEQAEATMREGLVADELQALLDFEQQQRGTFFGLMALRKVLLHAHRFGPPRPIPVERSKREVLNRLKHYVSLPISAETVSETLGGFPDRMVGPALRSMVNSPDAKTNVKQATEFALARWLQSWDSFVKHQEKQLEAIGKLEKEPPSAKNRSQLAAMKSILDSLPPEEENLQWQAEAESILADLEASTQSARIPQLKAVGHHIVRIDLEATKRMPTIAEQAKTARRNRVGQTVDNLELELVNGDQWNAIDRVGNIVVIQFSFTGCAPCVKMYADLAALKSEFADELDIVTIMQDHEIQTTKETAKKYDLTWPVSWDGDPGTLTQRWAIQSFPTVVILDREGTIAGRSLETARRLLEQADQ